MRNILKEIIAAKHKEVFLKSEKLPLEKIRLMKRKSGMRSFSKVLQEKKCHVISEFKRKSPSAGIITNADLKRIISGYESGGASAISILTDPDFFSGSMDDLINGKQYTSLPILRKDFIIDEYQVYESFIGGADIILLIAAILDPGDLFFLARLSGELGMEVLLEVRSEKEIKLYMNEYIDFVGVNNRNLDTLEINIETCARLKEKLPPGLPCIAESGLHSADKIAELSRLGYNAFLIGESLMKNNDPCDALVQLIKDSEYIIGKVQSPSL